MYAIMVTPARSLEMAVDRVQLLNFLAGGHETTAGAMIWSSLILATKPDIQEKLREEIIGFLGASAKRDYNAIESLYYLNNFCRELLRLYCPGK